jgi:hypothetical protein
MKDEWNNECPYDFKNIQFKPGTKTQPGTIADVFYYTFSVATGTNDATVTDHSLNEAYCFGNKIGVFVNSSKQTLSSNVFRNTSATSSCISNTFGYNTQNNTFGNECNSNTFGNECNSNTFGNDCDSNTLGNYCQQIIFNKDYVQNVIIENGNQYITLTSTEITSSSLPLRNITIAQGVNNSTTVKTISHNTLNDAFKTTYQSTNSQVINI